MSDSGRRREEDWLRVHQGLYNGWTRVATALQRSFHVQQRGLARTWGVLEQPRRWLPRARYWSERILVHCQRHWASLWTWNERSGG